MYSTRGIEAVASITELRSRTSEIIEQVREAEHGVLIQKNNDPLAVLVSYELYTKLIGQYEAPGQERKKKG